MAKSIAEAIKKLPAHITADAKPVSAKEIIAKICLACKWCVTHADALDQAEKWEKQFIKKLQERLSKTDSFGRHCRYTINSSSEYMIQGSAFIEPTDSESLKAEKAIISRCSQYYEAIQKLTTDQFEALCAGVLSLMGAEQVRLTPKTRDEGIDFYGRISLEKILRGDKLFPGTERQLSVWMIGQAKHFSTGHVDTLNVRELVGAVELARMRAYSTKPEARYKDLKVRLCDPVYCLFITTGLFSSDAWALLLRSGVVGMDGDMLCVYLAEKNAGLVNNQFTEDAFNAWVKQCETMNVDDSTSVSIEPIDEDDL
jgi:hypothetical protein